MLNVATASLMHARGIEIAIIGSGSSNLALGAVLAADGHSPHFFGQELDCPQFLESPGQPGLTGPSITRLNFQNKGSATEATLEQSDFLLVCGDSDTYRANLEKAAELARPGISIFIVDAPLGAAFELSNLILKQRKRMSLNLLEMGPLFAASEVAGDTIRVSGLRQRLTVCGRSLNETRHGLDLGKFLFKELVPASNVLERGLSDCSIFLQAALRFFLLRAGSSKIVDSPVLNYGDLGLLAAIENELRALAKALNIAVPKSEPIIEEYSSDLELEKSRLGRTLSQSIVLATDLAKLAYLPTPALDQLIDQSSNILERDFRREGRNLADLGLSELTLNEIVEFINA